MKTGKNRAKKIAGLILGLCLLLSLAACQESSGFPGEKEVAQYEKLYLKDINEAIHGLGLQVEKEENLPGAFSVEGPCKLAGTDFRQDLLSSTSEPRGFFGIRFTAEFADGKEAGKTALALYDEAVKLYGQPSTYPGMQNRLDREELEKGSLPEGQYAETWTAGQLTELTLRAISTEQGVQLTLTCQLQTVVDGKRLTTEELQERVASKQ